MTRADQPGIVDRETAGVEHRGNDLRAHRQSEGVTDLVEVRPEICGDRCQGSVDVDEPERRTVGLGDGAIERAAERGVLERSSPVRVVEQVVVDDLLGEQHPRGDVVDPARHREADACRRRLRLPGAGPTCRHDLTQPRRMLRTRIAREPETELASNHP